MATVTGLTAAKTFELLGKMIVGGSVDGAGHLILVADDDTTIDAGNVVGPTPDQKILARNADLGPSFYPFGTSYFGVTATQTGWPSSLGTIVTFRAEASRSVQWFTTKGGTSRTYVRSEDNGDIWTPFTELVPMVLASDAETQAGALTTKAVSPAGLKSVVGVGTGYRLQQVVKYASSGTFLKANYPGLRAICVKVQAGGGSGAGAATAAAGQNAYGTGGGGGGYAESFITDIAGLASSVTVTVGASVAGGAAGANDGNDGNGSSFGSLVVATPGMAGTTKGSSTLGGYIPGGAGGEGTAGDYRVSGSGGGGGYGAATLASGGFGGSSHLGGGGRTVGTGAGSGRQTGAPGGNYGGGGGGAMTNAGGAAIAGGSGAQGIVFVEIYV